MRKIEKFFELAANGAAVSIMDEELSHHPKRNLRLKTDPDHILNMKDINGNTLLYVAT